MEYNEENEIDICSSCVELQRLVWLHEETIESQKANIEDLRRHIETLQSTFGLGIIGKR